MLTALKSSTYFLSIFIQDVLQSFFKSCAKAIVMEIESGSTSIRMNELISMIHGLIEPVVELCSVSCLASALEDRLIQNWINDAICSENSAKGETVDAFDDPKRENVRRNFARLIASVCNKLYKQDSLVCSILSFLYLFIFHTGP